MNIELQLISMLIKEGDVEILEKVSSSGDIWADLRPVYQFIYDYFIEYGTIIKEDTLKAKYSALELGDYPEPLEFYIDYLRNKRVKQKVSELSSQLESLVSSGDFAKAEKILHKKAEDLANFKSEGKTVDYFSSLNNRIEAYKRRESNPGITGIPSGWANLDAYTMGWQAGEFDILFGKSKSFKTFILLQWALNAWIQKKNVLFYTREVQSSMLTKRLDALLTHTSYASLKKGFHDVNDFAKFIDDLRACINSEERGFFKIIDVSGVQDAPELVYLTSKVKAMKPDVLFVDGIYLIQGKGNSEWERVKSVTNSLKQMAISLDIPVIGTTQATKKSKAGNLGKEDLAYAPSFEQDCDYMFSINRKFDKILERLTPYLLIRAEASRDGEEFETACKAEFEEMSFNEISLEELEMAIGGEDAEDESDRPF